LPEVEAVLGPGVRTVEAGALDGLRMAEIESLRPHPGQAALATRLADGTPVVVSKEAIVTKVEAAIGRCVAAGASAILLLCTGQFPPLRSPVRVYQPDKLLRAFVDGVVPPQGRLGVLSPLASQAARAHTKWGAHGREVVAAIGSPYHGQEAFLQGVAELASQEPDVVLLDCMGFTSEHKQNARNVLVDRPVLLPITCIARMIAEVL